MVHDLEKRMSEFKVVGKTHPYKTEVFFVKATE